MVRRRGSLATVADPKKSLRPAWFDISDRKKGGARKFRGFDGVSLNRYAEALDENIQFLSGRLLTGQYSYSPLLPHFEEKKGGGYRVICVPTVRDRIVQRALLEFLRVYDEGRYAFENEVSFGFVKGKTVYEAVDAAKKLRAKHGWAYKTDISKFFDSIPRDELKAVLRSKIRVTGILKLLLDVCDCEAAPESAADARKLKHQGIVAGRGLRQGMPLSPYFSNVYLAEFDQKVIAQGFKMVRYADDLVCFADSKEECEEIDAFFRAELKKLKLDIHPLGTVGKCEIRAPDEAVEFLGVELALKNGAYVFQISNEMMMKKRARLLEMSNLNELVNKRTTITKFIRSLQSKIDGWKDAYDHCDNIGEFKTRLGDWHRNVINAVLVDGLGLPKDKLTKTAKQFLELDPLPPPKSGVKTA